MASKSALDPRRHPAWIFLFVAFVALLLFSLSFFVEVRIIFERPDYGDVTDAVRTLWRGVLGIATLGSFLIAVYNLVADRDPSDGPASAFEIKGKNHDVDVHLHVSDLSEDQEDNGNDRDENTEERVDESEERPEPAVEEETISEGR